jgi:hypothetical protein
MLLSAYPFSRITSRMKTFSYFRLNSGGTESVAIPFPSTRLPRKGFPCRYANSWKAFSTPFWSFYKDYTPEIKSFLRGKPDMAPQGSGAAPGASLQVWAGCHSSGPDLK